MATEKITIRLVLDTKGYKKGADSASRATDKVTQKANKTNTSMGKLGGNLGKVGIAFGAAFAGQKIISGISNAIDRAEEMNSLYAITETVLEATGFAANVTAEEMRELAKEQSLLTGIDKALITESNNLLLTFKAVRNEVGEGNDIFNQASGLILDLSVIMGTDAKSGAIQLGKALNDPILGVAALNRVGIQFNETQKEQIRGFQESGNLIGAQKIILGELEGQFGGTAAAAVDTTDQIGNAFKEASEVIGQEFLLILDDIAPALIGIAEGVGDVGASAAAAIGPLGDLVTKFLEIRAFGQDQPKEGLLQTILGDVSAFATGTLPEQIEQFIALFGRLREQADPDVLFAGGRQGATRRFLFGGLFDDLEALDAELAAERKLEVFGPKLPDTELDKFIKGLVAARPAVKDIGKAFGTSRAPLQNFAGEVKTAREELEGIAQVPLSRIADIIGEGDFSFPELAEIGFDLADLQEQFGLSQKSAKFLSQAIKEELIDQAFGATREPLQNFVGGLETVDGALQDTESRVEGADVKFHNLAAQVTTTVATVNKTKFKTKSFSDLRLEAKATADAIREIRLRMLEAADPAFAAIRAVERQEEAEKAYAEALANTEEGTRDRARAEADFAEATIETEAALVALGDGNLVNGIKLIGTALNKDFLEARELLVILGVLDAVTFQPKNLLIVPTFKDPGNPNEVGDAIREAEEKAARDLATFFEPGDGPKALGGPVHRGGRFLVGERGPEMFIPNQSGQIIPNHELTSGGITEGDTNITLEGSGDLIEDAQVVSLMLANRDLVRGGFRGGAS